MFRELMPILEGRTVMLTLARIDDATIRVCILPKRLREDTGENALCTPLTVIGAADELDRDLADQLRSYTSSVVKLGSNLAEIEATHTAAVKAVEEEKKKDLEKKRGKVAGSKTTSVATEPEARAGDQGRETGLRYERRSRRCCAAEPLRCGASGGRCVRTRTGHPCDK